MVTVLCSVLPSSPTSTRTRHTRSPPSQSAATTRCRYRTRGATPVSSATARMWARMSAPDAIVSGPAHPPPRGNGRPNVCMSESLRMPGYVNKLHVPPDSARASRMATWIPGRAARRRCAAHTPEMPAPTMTTSKASGALTSAATANRDADPTAAGASGMRAAMVGHAWGTPSTTDSAHRPPAARIAAVNRVESSSSSSPDPTYTATGGRAPRWGEKRGDTRAARASAATRSAPR